MKLNESDDFLALLQCTREGDLEKVSSLVENFAVEVNCVDRYDYSPLILASLCGHITVVRYLLQHGAILERDTFDGARCLYGALNDDIRNLLLQYDATTSVDMLQPFAAHLTSLRRDTASLASYDIKLECGSLSLNAHKFMLVARSPYFSKLLRQSDCRRRTTAEVHAPGKYVELILKHIYLDAVDLTMHPEEAEALSSIADLLGTTTLLKYSTDEKLSNKLQRQQLQCRAAQDDLEAFVKEDVIGKAWRIEGNSREALQIAKDYLLQDVCSSADALLAIDCKTYSMVYAVHRAMLIRSEYYLTVFTSGFSETYEHIPLLSLDTSREVAEVILTFLYVDRVNIPRKLALEVLEMSSFLLLNKERSLKSLAAIVITNNHVVLPENSNIYAIIRIAWQTQTQRLEQYCAKYIANHLDHFLHDTEFREVIRESADRISNRQDTDTIELIDDVRFYLGQVYGIYLDLDPIDDQTPGKSLSEDQNMPLTTYELRYNEQLAKLDELLEGMSLGA